MVVVQVRPDNAGAMSTNMKPVVIRLRSFAVVGTQQVSRVLTIPQPQKLLMTQMAMHYPGMTVLVGMPTVAPHIDRAKNTPMMRMETRPLIVSVTLGMERPVVSGGTLATLLNKTHLPGPFGPGGHFLYAVLLPKKPCQVRTYNPLFYLDEPPGRLLC